MKIAIQNSKGSFSDRWINYCNSAGIDYKIVNCYSVSVIEDISDCDALMWHFHQNNPTAALFAKQLLFSVERSGKKVFPDLNTSWCFDDKVGQKYLLESVDAPLASTWIFYDKLEALAWVKKCSYPKIFKLRSGAGSQNVRLVNGKREAARIIRKAFTRGFPVYDPATNLKERWRLFYLNKTTFKEVVKGIIRLIVPPSYSRIKGKEKGYVYFQEFIPANDYDIRVIVIGERAFAIKRLVRKNDFRASGSGNILYERCLFEENLIKLSFELANKLRSQCVAMDFIYDKRNPLLLEISYGFSPEGYDACPGYWDKNMKWHEGKFDPYGWMVENLIKEIPSNKHMTEEISD